MKIYHLTKTRNVESIKRLGILPGFSHGLDRLRKKRNCVWLTNDPVYIILHQGGPVWAKDISIIEVEVGNLIPVVYEATGTISKFEFVVDEVKPSQIKEIIDLAEIVT